MCPFTIFPWHLFTFKSSVTLGVDPGSSQLPRVPWLLWDVWELGFAPGRELPPAQHGGPLINACPATRMQKLPIGFTDHTRPFPQNPACRCV